MEMLEQLIFFLQNGWIDSKNACILPSEENPGYFNLWAAFEENKYYLQYEYLPGEQCLAFGEFLNAQLRTQYYQTPILIDEDDPNQELVVRMMTRVPTPVALTEMQKIGIKIALQDPQLTDLATDIIEGKI